MVQKEVGRRLAASPGSKNWSPLSVFSQMVFRIEQCFDVSATHFKPQPQVESSVLRLTPLPGGGDKITPEFQRVVRASFRQRRKTLSNNLVPELISDAATAQEIFQDTGLEPKARAESISIGQFLKLTAALAERKLV